MPDFLEDHLRYLEAAARESEAVDYDAVSAHLPEALRPRVAALATVLGVDAFQALQEGCDLASLERERELRREMAARMADEASRLGLPLPGDGGVQP